MKKTVPLEDLVEQVKNKKYEEQSKEQELLHIQHELDVLQAQITKQYKGNLPVPIAEVLLDLPKDCPEMGTIPSKPHYLSCCCPYNTFPV